MSQPLEVVPGGTPKIDRDYVINLSGKDYPTWPGTLDLAHQKGLKRLSTEILQVPGPENNHTAIVQATAEFEDGSVFSDIADASPHNVKPQMAKFALTMAATRAKGRALRDACNVGEALQEEMDEAPPQRPPSRPQPPRERNVPYPGNRPAPPAKEVVETPQGTVNKSTGEVVKPAADPDRLEAERRFRAGIRELLAFGNTVESLKIEKGTPLWKLLSHAESLKVPYEQINLSAVKDTRKILVAVEELEFVLDNLRAEQGGGPPDLFADE